RTSYRTMKTRGRNLTRSTTAKVCAPAATMGAREGMAVSLQTLRRMSSRILAMRTLSQGQRRKETLRRRLPASRGQQQQHRSSSLVNRRPRPRAISFARRRRSLVRPTHMTPSNCYLSSRFTRVSEVAKLQTTPSYI
ncbi:unnamed protein product, partial [Mycena citricolor]